MTILNEKIVELANALVDEIKESFDGASMHQELSLEIEQVKEFVEDRFGDICKDLDQRVDDSVRNHCDNHFVTEEDISEFVKSEDISDLELEVEGNTELINDLHRQIDSLKNLVTQSLTAQRDAIDDQITEFNWALNQGA